MRKRQKLTDFFNGGGSSANVTTPTPPPSSSVRGPRTARTTSSALSDPLPVATQLQGTQDHTTKQQQLLSSSATSLGSARSPAPPAPPKSLDMRVSASSLSQCSRPSSAAKSSDENMSESNSQVWSPRQPKAITYSKRESTAFSEELRVAAAQLWKDTLRRSRVQHSSSSSNQPHHQAIHALSPRFSQPTVTDLSLLIPAKEVDSESQLRRTLNPNEVAEQLTQPFVEEDEEDDRDIPSDCPPTSSSKKSADDITSHGTPSCTYSQARSTTTSVGGGVPTGGTETIKKGKRPLSEATDVQRALLRYQAQSLLNQKLFDQEPHQAEKGRGKPNSDTVPLAINAAWSDRETLELVRCARRIVDQLSSKETSPHAASSPPSAQQSSQNPHTPVSSSFFGSGSSQRTPRTVVVSHASGGLNLRHHQRPMAVPSAPKGLPSVASFEHSACLHVSMETQGATSSNSDDINHQQTNPNRTLRNHHHSLESSGLHLESSDSNHLIDTQSMTFVRVWKERNEALRWFQQMNALLEGSACGLYLPLGMFGIPPSVLLQYGSDTVSVTWLPPLANPKGIPTQLDPELLHWNLTEFVKRLWGASSALNMVATASLQCGEALPPLSVTKHLDALQTVQLCEGVDGRLYAMNFQGPVHIPLTRTEDGHAKCHRMAKLYDNVCNHSNLGFSTGVIVGEIAHCLSVTVREGKTKEEAEATLRLVKELSQQAFGEVEKAYRWDSSQRTERNQTLSVAPTASSIASSTVSPRAGGLSRVSSPPPSIDATPAAVAAYVFQQATSALPPLLMFHRHSDPFLYLEHIANAQRKALRRPSVTLTTSGDPQTMERVANEDPLHMGLARKTSVSSLGGDHSPIAAIDSLLNLAAKLSREQSPLTAMLYVAASRAAAVTSSSLPESMLRSSTVRRMVRTVTNFVSMQLHHGKGLEQDRILVAERLRATVEVVIQSIEQTVFSNLPTTKKVVVVGAFNNSPDRQPRSWSIANPDNDADEHEEVNEDQESTVSSLSSPSDSHGLERLFRALVRQQRGGDADSFRQHSQLVLETVRAWGRTLRPSLAPAATLLQPDAATTKNSRLPSAADPHFLLPFSTTLRAFAEVSLGMALPLLCEHLRLWERLIHLHSSEGKDSTRHNPTHPPHNKFASRINPQSNGQSTVAHQQSISNFLTSSVDEQQWTLLPRGFSREVDTDSICSKPEHWTDEVQTYRSFASHETPRTAALRERRQSGSVWSLSTFHNILSAIAQNTVTLNNNNNNNNNNSKGRDGNSFLVAAVSHPSKLHSFVGDVFLLGEQAQTVDGTGGDGGSSKNNNNKRTKAQEKSLMWTAEVLQELRHTVRDVLFSLLDATSYMIHRCVSIVDANSLSAVALPSPTQIQTRHPFDSGDFQSLSASEPQEMSTSPRMLWHERTLLCGLCPQFVPLVFPNVDRSVALSVITRSVVDPVALTCYTIALFPIVWLAEHPTLFESVATKSVPLTTSNLQHITKSGATDTNPQKGGQTSCLPLHLECQQVSRLGSFLKAASRKPLLVGSGPESRDFSLLLSRMLAMLLAEACLFHGVDSDFHSSDLQTMLERYAEGFRSLQLAVAQVTELVLTQPPPVHCSDAAHQHHPFVVKLRTALEPFDDPSVTAYGVQLAAQLQLRRSSSYSATLAGAHSPDVALSPSSTTPPLQPSPIHTPAASALLTRHAHDYRYLSRLVDTTTFRRASILTTTDTLPSIQSVGLVPSEFPMSSPAASVMPGVAHFSFVNGWSTGPQYTNHTDK